MMIKPTRPRKHSIGQRLDFLDTRLRSSMLLRARRLAEAREDQLLMRDADIRATMNVYGDAATAEIRSLNSILN